MVSAVGGWVRLSVVANGYVVFALVLASALLQYTSPRIHSY